MNKIYKVYDSEMNQIVSMFSRNAALSFIEENCGYYSEAEEDEWDEIYGRSYGYREDFHSDI